MIVLRTNKTCMSKNLLKLKKEFKTNWKEDMGRLLYTGWNCNSVEFLQKQQVLRS